VKITRVAAPLFLVVLLVPPVAVGQPRPGIPPIGFLTTFPSANDLRFEAFKQKLRELGHVEGKTITIDYRSAEGKYDRLPALAAELVRRNVTVLVADGGTPPMEAAWNATRTIPTVFTAVADPEAQGFVTSLARPGGNVTGLSVQHPEFAPKLLELLKEILPSAKRIAILSNPTNSSLPRVLGEMQTAARALGLAIQIVNARAPDEFEGAFAEIARSRPAGLVILTDALFTSEASQLTTLAVRHRLPTMGGSMRSPRAAAFRATGQTVWTWSAAAPSSWTRSSRAPSLVSFRSSSP
jgi:putative tryptophan/tyrosine transport system substrate-binding protein